MTINVLFMLAQHNQSTSFHTWIYDVYQFISDDRITIDGHINIIFLQSFQRVISIFRTISLDMISEICYILDIMNGQSYPDVDIVEPNPSSSIEISPKHHQVARLVALGFNNRQIALKLGMSEVTISVVSKSPMFKMVVKELSDELDNAAKQAQSTLIEAAPRAAEKLVDIMDTVENVRLRRDTCLDVMKAAGVVKSDDKPTLNININEAKMALIFDTLKEMKR